LGLAGALKKIGGQTSGSRLRHSQAPILSHMYFADGLAAKLAALSTHPPLDRRIRRLDPEFDGRFPALRGIEPGEAFHEIFPLEEGIAAASGNFPDPPSSPDLFHNSALVAATSEKVLRTMGNPTMEHMRRARQLIDSLPPQVLKAARNPFEARAVIYCLLLDSHEELRENQLILLENHTDPRTWQACRKLMPDLLKMPREGRLPLIDLCLPALTLLSSVQYRDFGKNIELLVKADQRINLFEFALHHLLKRHLASRFGKAEQNYFRQGSIPAVKEEISCILSLLARAGQSGSAAEITFRQAAAVFKKDAALFSFQSPERCSLKHLDLALTLLGRVSFAIRAKVINACLECIIHDEKITIEEAEILRAIADALGCPVPPWLRGPAVKTDERDVNSAR
jgi:hypothetical protein